MSVIVKETGTKYPPAPDGVHGAVCIDVVDKGVLQSEWQGQKRTRHVVVLRWAIDEIRDDEKNYFVEKWYTASLSEKAALRADLELWRGKKFTREELKGFDLENVLGKGCQLVTLQAEKGDNVYANVKGVMPLSKGAVVMPIPTDYIREKDRPSENGTALVEDPEDNRAESWRDSDLSDLPF